MQTTHHIERATVQSQRATLYQTVVRRVVRKIHTVHPTRAVLVKQRERQLSALCIFAITQQSFHHNAIRICVCGGGDKSAVERNVHLRKQTVQKQIARSDRRIHRQIGTIGPSYLGFYIEHCVCKVFPAGPTSNSIGEPSATVVYG